MLTCGFASPCCRLFPPLHARLCYVLRSLLLPRVNKATVFGVLPNNLQEVHREVQSTKTRNHLIFVLLDSPFQVDQRVIQGLVNGDDRVFLPYLQGDLHTASYYSVQCIELVCCCLNYWHATHSVYCRFSVLF